MMFRNRIISAFALVLTVVISLAASAGVSRAAAPEWSGGFPKIVQNDVLLQWQPVKGATEYKVYKSELKDKGLKLLATVKANRHIDKGVGAGKTVYYYVAPVIGGKEGERSSAGVITTVKEKVFVPLKTPKLAGGHVKELPGGMYTVGVRWENAGGTDFVGVNVYRSTKKGKEYAMIGSSSGDSFEDKDVKQGDTYYYVVTAVDSQFKETKYSNEITVQMPAIPVAAKGETPQAAEKVPPTKMRRAKLLFTIPVDKKDPAPEGALEIAVDEAVGHIYVTCSIYGGILVYNMEGKFQFGIRKDGVNGKEKFNIGLGLALGENGNFYAITDANNAEVSEFNFAGKRLDTFKVEPSHVAKGLKPMIYDLALDNEGRMYITDYALGKVHAFDAKHKHLFDISTPVAEKENPKFIKNPTYAVMTRKGDLAFMDVGTARVQVYGTDGKYKRTIGKPGSGAGELFYPTGICSGKDGEIFVASGMAPNIEAFAEDGKFQYALCNEKGEGPLNLGAQSGIYADSNNRFYIAEVALNRISVYQLLDGLIEVVPPK